MRLLAAPTVTFAEIDELLTQLDWFLEDESQTPPMIPGEPELCVYSHRQVDARITYTFNPVIALRVLAFAGGDAGAQQRIVGARLPCLGDAELLRLRASADPAEAALGRVASACAGRQSGFAWLGDEEMRRQVLRWLVRDVRRANAHVGEAIEHGLADPDEEVRRTAERAAAHFARSRPAPRAPHDDESLLDYALSTPLEAAPWPNRLPPGVERTDEGFVLARSRIALVWVGPVAHWLGAGAQVRRVTSPGFLIAREPAPPVTFAEAVAVAEERARAEGLPVQLATADQWEMAARGPDGRRFPWGNFAMPDAAERVSPWGVAGIGRDPEWTADGVVCGAGEACADRRPASSGERAAVRIVVAPPQREPG